MECIFGKLMQVFEQINLKFTVLAIIVQNTNTNKATAFNTSPKLM